MKIDIQAHNFAMTHALYGHIERRLGFALSNRDGYIRHVVVHLSDVNGPNGNEYKCCQVRVVLPQLDDVIVEDVEANIYTAIDRAADRAGRTVGRRLDRHRSPGKHDMNTITSTDDVLGRDLN